jgi:soluble lytic murein transglycosylase-like protein
MQVNSHWLPQLKPYGITRDSLFEPCLNVHIGAWVLAQKIRAHGYNWPGFAAYHSATPEKQRRYQALLVNAYKRRFEP